MKDLGTIAEFAKAQGFGILSKVRANTNGYKYVTFCSVDADGNAIKDGAENIYLSKALAEEVELGAKLDRELPVKEVTNEAGEARTKICSPSGGEFDAI